MISTDDLPNWRRWPEKQASGVNRGYNQAYYNTNRRDHYLTISTRTYENLDKARVSVTLNTPDGKEGESFEGTYDEQDALLDRAEELGRDLMADHPCPSDGDRDAIEALTDLHDALRDNGCPPQHDADFCGWGTVGGDPGFQITPLVKSENEWKASDTPAEADRLLIHFNVDGKESGLRYREWKDRDSDGEVRHKHEPQNPESITGKLHAALQDAGFDPCGRDEIAHGGHQMHWDHNVHYRAAVEVPDDLELPDTVGERRHGLFA